MLRRALLAIIWLLVLLVSVLLINTLRYPHRQVQASMTEALKVKIDEAAIAERLSQVLRFRTVSYQDASQIDGNEFTNLHAYIERSFPKLHSTLMKEVVGDYSLLYTWKGKDDKARSILLAGHQDVDPVEPGTEARWQRPPFEGRLADGYIWGRGAMDDKSGTMAILEAIEALVAEGFQPERTIYLAFGHDEEVGGYKGAAKIAALLAARNVEQEYVLDEGLAISDGIVPVPVPVALIGIAEKGTVSLELSAESEGGHSSIPPPHTAIGIVSAAVTKVEEHQMAAGLRGVAEQMFDYIGPEMSFGKRLVFANLWLFRRLVEHQLSASAAMRAALRTTTAVTLIEGGIKENVLPTKARAVVNFRILPGENIAGVIAHARDVIKDSRVKIGRYGNLAWEPSIVSETTATGFLLLQRTIRQVFPDAISAPALVVGATDSRHYANLTKNTYRFRPQRFGPQDVKRYHGTDERISTSIYAQCVRFYYQLIRNWSQEGLKAL